MTKDKNAKDEYAFGSTEDVAAQNEQMRIDNNQAAKNISIRVYWTLHYFTWLHFYIRKKFEISFVAL